MAGGVDDDFAGGAPISVASVGIFADGGEDDDGVVDGEADEAEGAEDGGESEEGVEEPQG